MFIVNKAYFKNTFNIKSIYVSKSDMLLEFFLNSDAYIKYRKTILTENRSLKFNFETNVSNSMSFEQEYVCETPYQLKEMLENYMGTNEYNKLIKVVKKIEKEETLQEKNIEILMNDDAYLLSEDLKIFCNFAKDIKELENFINSKDMYRYNEEKNEVEVDSCTPKLVFEKINYNSKGSELKLNFSMELFGTSFTFDDMYFHNNKYRFKNIYNSVDEMVEAELVKAEERKALFLSLSNKTIEEKKVVARY